MRLIAIVLFLLFATACSQKYLRVDNAELIARYRVQIEAYNQRVSQLKASLDIRASGVMGSFIHEQADIVVSSPHYLYWSLRSFFGPPSLLLACNGQYVTMYDFTGHHEPPYQKISLQDDSFFELMDFSFHPTSLINLLLAKIPLAGGKEVELKAADGKLEIRAMLNNGWEMRSVFDHIQERVRETRLLNHALGISYQVKYDNFKESSGIYFPRSLILFAKGPSRFAKFNIELLEIELNGEPTLPDMFYIKPH